MSLQYTIKQALKALLRRKRRVLAPVQAYDLWAGSYDSDQGNLMVALDEALFAELLHDMSLQGRVIADIGCGTGRHWKRLLAQQPATLMGFDVSQGMLDRLLLKYPGSQVALLQDERLDALADGSCDLVVSTLAFAHFPEPEKMMREWCRVLKAGGSIVITDGHPVSFQMGADITFAQDRKTYAIAHHIHTLPHLLETARRLGCTVVALEHRVIDDSVKHFYEKQQALSTYYKFEGVPIIYGLHLRKDL